MSAQLADAPATSTLDTAAAPAVGTVVGAERWPYVSAHPGCWGRPRAGVVLAAADPRAWEGTLAFPGRPSAEEAARHVAENRARGLDDAGRVPVLWTRDDGSTVVHREAVAQVRPYADDVAAWEAARTAALARCGPALPPPA